MKLASTSYGGAAGSGSPAGGGGPGDVPALVMLHGLFGSGDNLRGLGRAFEDRFTVVYPDLPNHGDSPHSDDVGYGVLAEAVATLVERGDFPRVAVAGHSMGGKVAMRLALDRPDLVAALVVLDMAPRRYEPSHGAIFDALLALPVDEVESRADADRMLADAIPSRPVRSFLLKNLVKEDGAYRWRLNLPVLKREYVTILGWEGEGAFEGPALFVGGAKSKYLDPARDDDLVRAHFPQARIEMLDGAGHWIHSERPDDVRRLMSDFLATVAGDAS
ncbi:MAG: alpha/beta fold hydrolase [Spirochaetota bacterium]